MLRVIPAGEIGRGAADPVEPAAWDAVSPIVAAVRAEGAAAARRYGERFGEVAPGEPLVLDRAEVRRRAAAVPPEDLDLLRRVAGRITAFAAAQRDALRPVDFAVPGGRAGHTLEPVLAAGCYAPGGRYPLPSSVLMTACVARAAGVPRVVVASPRPAPITYAAAAIADADQMIVLGGAQAIAAMAYGIDGLSPVDLIAGPGNRFVTAAKKMVLGTVGIDMLAGPSELAVLEDASAVDPAVIAADLLAQAEHDSDARPVLVTTSPKLARAVAAEVARQVALLPEPNRATAARACANGFAAVAASLDEAIAAVDRLAPEHLEVLAPDPRAVAARCRNAGGVFLGAGAAEVFGDYGAGPNHTLPTGGSARFAAGLSVYTFLRARAWLDVRPDAGLVDDTARLARLEGLEAHARAAQARRPH
jgi:phosphoribosyl-ATP pyrophosphohydrolase/phosphoribosyl-AMP cyclohydrolase/histidinol dehydrogenase